MSQRGNALLQKNAPKFGTHVVVRDTWKEKDATEHLRTDDGDSKRYNDSFWNPGVDATADLVVKDGEDLLVVGSTLTESSPGTRTFLVMAVENSDYGATRVKQTVQLEFTEGYTPTEVDEG